LRFRYSGIELDVLFARLALKEGRFQILEKFVH
jgi:hypothetical protein